MDHLQLENREYLTGKQVRDLLVVSRATFYRLYYPTLIKDPRTMSSFGRLLYARESVMAFLKPAYEEEEKITKRRERARARFQKGVDSNMI